MHALKQNYYFSVTKKHNDHNVSKQNQKKKKIHHETELCEKGRHMYKTVKRATN